MRNVVCVLLFALTTLLIPAQTSPDESKVVQERTVWVRSVIQLVASIKPGMTRDELEAKGFVQDGGFYSNLRYVYKYCGCIKVDVTFKPAVAPQHESPDDIIETISKPYLEEFTSD